MSSKKIIFASDFAPIRNFADRMRQDPAAVYGDLLTPLRQADYRIVNLESPLTSSTEYIVKSGAAFSGRPEHIGALTAGGFQAAVCANNHAFDCGASGFLETGALLESCGIACVGAGSDYRRAAAPLTFELDGIGIALFAVSEGEDMQGAAADHAGVRPWEVEELSEQIREAGRDYDVVLVSAHCGLEYQPYPSFYVYQAFRQWAAAGADLIIGHHPHVPQGMTCFGKCPAYFSLGNFIFYQPTDLYYRKIGYLLEFEVSRSGVTAHRPLPYRITDAGVHSLTGAAEEEFRQLFQELSAPLQTEAGARQAWHAVLAYHGVTGFQQELEKILQTLWTCPPKGAAMLRNRVNCRQHFTQWTDGMTRIMEGTLAEAPEQYIDMVRAYMTRTAGEKK